MNGLQPIRKGKKQQEEGDSGRKKEKKKLRPAGKEIVLCKLRIPFAS